MRVLIIEPEKTLFQSLRLYTEHQKNCEVAAAHSLREGFDLWQSTSFDLVLSTDSLPDGLGLEMLKVFVEQNPKIIAILMTGRLDEGLKRQASAAGIRAYLEKPFDLHQLEAAMGHPMMNVR